ncbi:Putative uncharacterized protein [Lacticaseibacillus paracasei]|nr:Putative uncharacterized protein [Lacticaseibacillus paracasei]
MHGLLFIL